MFSIENILVITALLGAAIIGGGLFVFSSFIMKSLARLAPAEGIAAMQSINVVVMNVSFIGTFMGTAALSVAILFISFGEAGSMAGTLVNIGGVLYLIGTFLVTARGNVPLNHKLAAVDANDASSVQVWEDYLVRWTRLNTLRTAAALAAVLCFAAALAIA